MSEVMDAIARANQYQTFFKVMLPLAQPGLISIGIFNFLGMWNQYLLPVVLMTNAKRYLLTQGLAYMLHQQYYQNDWSALFAAVTMIMVPTFLMGGTLPVLLKRFAAGDRTIGGHAGLLYGLNTAGAVVGNETRRLRRSPRQLARR